MESCNCIALIVFVADYACTGEQLSKQLTFRRSDSWTAVLAMRRIREPAARRTNRYRWLAVRVRGFQNGGLHCGCCSGEGLLGW